jgi:hypothetical protein
VIRSSPGVGVLKAGWHCGGDPNSNGTVADCPDCRKCVGNTCEADASANGSFNASKNTCCQNGESVPNSPISDLSKCPNRVANSNWQFQYDGCSLQPLPAAFRNNRGASTHSFLTITYPIRLTRSHVMNMIVVIKPAPKKPIS